LSTCRIGSDLVMHYQVDDFTNPWERAQAILLLHGNAESGAAWFAWVPELARHYRVVRPDMRGFGASTPMARDYPWTLERIIDDYRFLLGELGVERCHLVGAKLGGTIARRFAARHPEMVLTLTLVGTPAPNRGLGADLGHRVKEMEEQGAAHWAERTMAGRLGSEFPEAGVRWWTALMSRTATSTLAGFTERIADVDISADLPAIRCPTLVITTEGSALGSVEETRTWQKRIPRSRLVVLPGNSYHVAASHAERCAQETLAFIRQSGLGEGASPAG
jgi:pimeloyl-ACP methyl ester carboxylesterase